MFSLHPSDFVVQTASVSRFSDVGGCDKAIAEIEKLLNHFRHPEVFSELGATPPQGFLLHGPPGCGKTLLAHAIAGVSGGWTPRRPPLGPVSG